MPVLDADGIRLPRHVVRNHKFETQNSNSIEFEVHRQMKNHQLRLHPLRFVRTKQRFEFDEALDIGLEIDCRYSDDDPCLQVQFDPLLSAFMVIAVSLI